MYSHAIGEMIAAGRVAAAGGFVGPFFGFVSASAPAASVYTLLLDTDIDATNAVIFVTNEGPGVGTVGHNQTADNTILVSTFGAAEAPANRAFYIEVWRKAIA